MKPFKAHDYPGVYRDLGIDLNKLGCVMLDVDVRDPVFTLSLEDLKAMRPSDLYYAKNKDRFWINGYNPSHITLLYGLLESGEAYSRYIHEILRDSEVEKLTVGSVGFFESPYEDEEYYCIVAHIDLGRSPGLLEAHQRLELLPHINTFPGYKAHMTLAYIKKDEEKRDEIVKMFSGKLVGTSLKAGALNLGGNK